MSDAEASESSELPVALSQYSARLADALGGVSPASLVQIAEDAQMTVGHALMQVLQGASKPRAGAHG